MSAPCPKCTGTGLLTDGTACDCVVGTMRRDESAKTYSREQVPPLCTGAQTTIGAIRSRALSRRRAAIARLMSQKRSER